MAAQSFRKKPVVIEALRYTLENRDDVIAWCQATHTAIGEYGEEYELESLRIETLEGTMRVDPGDWIIRGVKGEVYPCKPDIFEATYEPAGERVTDPAAHTPSDSAGAPDVDKLAETAARGLRAAREFLNTLPLTDGASKRAIDREFIAVKLVPGGLAALTDLAATARRSYPESWNEEIRAVEADRDSLRMALEAEKHNHRKDNTYLIEERDRLARRVAELEAALRPFVDEYDFHAADYLAQRVDGEEARVFTARTVEFLIEHQRAARKVLAGDGGGA